MYTVFVYGTLKRGYGNNVLLRGSEFLGTAILKEDDGLYRMKQVGFPAIYDAKDVHEANGKVVGEVYNVISEAVMNSLDRLEGNGTMYLREERRCFFTDPILDGDGIGNAPIAWVYLATPDFQRRIHNSPDILPNDRGELIWSRYAE